MYRFKSRYSGHPTTGGWIAVTGYLGTFVYLCVVRKLNDTLQNNET
jgi:hypothetical protein